MKRLLPWLKNAHVLLFLLVPLLTIYSLNTTEVDGESLVRPLLMLLVAVIFLAPVCWLIAKRNAERAAWILSALTLFLFAVDMYQGILFWATNVFFYIYGWITSGSPEFWLSAGFRYNAGIVLWLLAAVFSIWFLRRTKRELTPTFWLAAVALLVLPCWRIAGSVVAQYQGEVTAKKAQATSQQVPNTISSESPDLYVIVLDAYARQDILRSEFGRDNEPFLKDLEKRGFVVARKSRSNYVQTPLCIASALNMDYLVRDARGGDLGTVQPMIDHNAIAALLRTHGYRFLSIPTGYEMTAAPSADHIYSPDNSLPLWQKPFPSPFEELVYRSTPLASPQTPVRTSIIQHRMRIVSAFRNLETMGQIAAPKFVYAHILAPHPPFLLDENGNPAEPEGKSFSGLGDASDYNGSHDMYIRGYAKQIGYVNKATLKAIDAIQTAQKRPYVIVVMGDHGARMKTSWSSLEQTDPYEATANLFAVYAPEQGGKRAALVKRFEATVTPINAFRLLMNTYYGTRYAPLPDRSFYSMKFKPLDFSEITGAIDAVDKKSGAMR